MEDNSGIVREVLRMPSDMVDEIKPVQLLRDLHLPPKHFRSGAVLAQSDNHGVGFRVLALKLSSSSRQQRLRVSLVL